MTKGCASGRKNTDHPHISSLRKDGIKRAGEGGEFEGRGTTSRARRDRMAARRAVPVATKEATGIDSNARGAPAPQEIISYIPRCMAARTACTLAAMSGAPTSSETRAQQRAP